MSDVTIQLRTYFEENIDHVAVDEIFVHEAKPASLPPGHRPRWAVALAGVAAVVLLTVMVWLVGRGEEPVATVPTLETGSRAWIDLTDQGLSSMGYLATNGEAFVFADWGLRLSSPDGETWSETPSGSANLAALHGAPDGFLAVDWEATVVGHPMVWVSADGLDWAETPSETRMNAKRVAGFQYLGLTVEEILRLAPPNTAFSGSGVMMKLDDSYVAHYWSGELKGAISADGISWESFEPAPHLASWLDPDLTRSSIELGYSSSGRSWGDLFWSGTFAVSQGRALALTGDDTGHRLWESTDGITWTEVTPEYVAAPGFDPFTTPAGLNEQFPGSATFGITSSSTGWYIFSWFKQEFAVLFSPDGRTWTPLTPPEDPGDEVAPRVVGDTIFLTPHPDPEG